MNRQKITMYIAGIACLAFLLGTATPSHAAVIDVRLDFNDASTAPGGNWNTMDDPAVAESSLTDFASGLPTAVDVTLSGVSDSSSTGQWGSRAEDPPWSVTDALDDRFFILEGDSGSMVISGLTPGLGYDIEIASSYGGAGTSGNAPGEYELTDADGLVEGFNGFTSGSLGTTVQWEPRLEADSGSPGGVEGWLVWTDAVADVNGELTMSLAAPDGSGNPRIALNAMQITGGEIPEPATAGLLALGAVGLLVRRRRQA